MKSFASDFAGHLLAGCTWLLLASANCATASTASASELPSATAADQGVLRATLANGLRVVIVRNTLAPVVATSVNYLVGSDEAPDGLSRHGACAGAHDVPRQPRPDRRPARQYRQRHGRQLQRQHAREPDAVSLHRAVRGSRCRAAYRSAAHAGRARHRRRTGTRSAAPSSRKWRRTSPIPATSCTRSCAQSMFAGTPYEHDALGTRPVVRQDDRRDAEAVSRHLVRAQQRDPGHRRRSSIPQATLAKVQDAVRRHPVARHLPARPPMHAAAACSRIVHVDTDQPGRHADDRACACRASTARISRRSKCLSDVLSSQRFDLYGLVPQGKALGAGLLARSAAARRAWLRRRCRSRPATIPRRSKPRCARSSTKVVHDGVPPDLVAAAKLQERSAGRIPEEFHRGPGLGLGGCGGALRPEFAGRRSGAHREGHGRRRQPRRAQISRSRSCGHRGDGAARLGQAGGRRAAASAARRTSRWAKPSRRQLPDWAQKRARTASRCRRRPRIPSSARLPTASP